MLLIDAGNTRLKWTVRDADDATCRSGACAFEGRALETEFTLLSEQLSVTRVIVTTVRSEADRSTLDELVQKCLGVTPEFYWTEESRAGLKNAYEDPSIMGADRWHALVAAWKHLRESFILIDAGSAITVEFVNDQGQHLGGYILPGRRLQLESLSLNTPRVLYDSDAAVQTMPGKNTTECVHNGINWQRQLLIDRLMAMREFRHRVITGGDAEHWLTLGLKAHHWANLVFDGLAICASEAP